MDRADISKPRPILLAAWAVLIALYAAVVITWPDKFFAEDSYFYFQVAWNFARGAGSTFNNFMPTNGYHPLWMLICALVFKVLPAKTAAVHGIAFVICAFDAAMLTIVARLLNRSGSGMWWIAYVILIPFCFMSQLGTEGALSGLLLALLAFEAYHFVTAPAGSSAFCCNLLAALAVLARLDNIFIVAFVWLAMFLFVPRATRAIVLRLQLACIPVYLVLWGSYILSNEHYFHVLQPISGMLKSTGQEPHKLFSNLPPHSAWFALAILVPCFLYLAMLKRDLFFRVVELPFTLGVLCHGAYIVFRMSSETRWSWYFTSWMLIAGIMAARVVADIAGRLPAAVAPALKSALAYGCLLFLAAVWVKSSYLHTTRMADTGRPTDFQDAVANTAGIHTALAFDYPGRFAYYSDVRIVPLDGLMGDRHFQQELATGGIAQYVAVNHIQGFIGPAIPMDDATAANFCHHIHNGAVQFNCVQTGPNAWDVRSANVYSRLPHGFAGTLLLDDADIVWTEPNLVSVWRLHPDALLHAVP